ncbi:MAG: transporter substrate-binding domain-containing protein [Chlamydiota bacterium]
MKKIFLVFLFLVFCGCNSAHKKETIRIGIDSKFYPLDFEEQQTYVYGFIQEMLLEMAKELSIEIEQVNANWDVLFEGLDSSKNQMSRYDVVISSKKPHNFNQAHYHFSPIFLDTGLVLVLPKEAKETSWKELVGKRIGSIGQYTFLQEKEGILVTFYEKFPEMCDDLIEGKIEACVIPNVFSIYYLRNLYVKDLKITSFVTKEGLQFISLNETKGKAKELIEKGMAILEKKHILEKLKIKWGLADPSLWEANWKD